MEDRKSISEIKNKEVQEEVFKLMEIFDESFLNYELELVICHPVNPVDIYEGEKLYYKVLHGRGRNVYCNVYFRTIDCQTKKDVQCKVLEWWSRDASKAIHGSEEVSRIIQDYIRRGINEYLHTDFSREDMHEIYCKLGNRINHELTLKFIDSKFDMKVLGESK